MVGGVPCHLFRGHCLARRLVEQGNATASIRRRVDMKRTNGYVVGRKTVRGIPTWSVKVQYDSHPLNGQKLNVVGNAPNLRPALDVDFLVLEQGGLSIAADVSPRGVVSAHEEGIKQMRKSAWKMVAALGALML